MTFTVEGNTVFSWRAVKIKMEFISFPSKFMGLQTAPTLDTLLLIWLADLYLWTDCLQTVTQEQVLTQGTTYSIAEIFSLARTRVAGLCVSLTVADQLLRAASQSLQALWK